jgi:hypothetical protein
MACTVAVPGQGFHTIPARTARTGQPEQYTQNRTGRAGQA